MRLIKSGVVLLGAILLLSCSRKEEPLTKSAISLNFPQRLRSSQISSSKSISSQKISDLPSGYVPSHLIINVHSSEAGGGLLAYYSWDGCENDKCSPETLTPMPTSVYLDDIPNGPGRLVQVMVVGEDPTGLQPGYVFMYGDASVNLNGGEASVLIDPVVQGLAGYDHNFEGRYLTAANEGPTGLLQVMIQAPGSKPDILIGEEWMYGGYFSTFYVDGAHFKHYMPEHGLSLFESINGVSSSLTLGSHLIKIENPTYNVRSMMGYNSSYTNRIRKKRTTFVGYFSDTGGLTGGKNVAWNGNSMIPDAYLSYDSTSNLWSNPISWIPASTSSNDIRIIAGSGGAQSGTEFQDHFYIKSDRFRNGDGLPGFKGPFKQLMTSSGSGGSSWESLITWSTVNSGDLAISWQTLPGVFSGPGAISGVTVLYSYQPGLSLDVFRVKHGNGVSCNAVLGSGFSAAYVDQTAGTNNAYSTTLDFGTPLTNCNLNDAKVVLCPTRYSGADMLPIGYETYISSSSGTGCGGGGGGLTATAFDLQFPSNTVPPNICVPFKVRGIVTTSATDGVIPANVNVGVSASNAGLGIYSDPSCASTLTFPETFTNGPWILYAMTTLASGGSLVTVSDEDGTIDMPSTTTSPSLGFAAGSGASSMIAWPFRNNITNSECLEVMMIATDAGGVPVLASGGWTYTITQISGSPGIFYSDPSCTSSISSAPTANFSSSSAFTSIFYKNTNPGTVTFSYSNGQGWTNPADQSINISP